MYMYAHIIPLRTMNVGISRIEYEYIILCLEIVNNIKPNVKKFMESRSYVYIQSYTCML